MMETLIELAQEAVYEMRHLSTDTEHCLAQDLQEALDNLHQTVALPVADYETRPVTPHPLDTLAQAIVLLYSLDVEDHYSATGNCHAAKAQELGISHTSYRQSIYQATKRLKQALNP